MPKKRIQRDINRKGIDHVFSNTSDSEDSSSTKEKQVDISAHLKVGVCMDENGKIIDVYPLVKQPYTGTDTNKDDYNKEVPLDDYGHD
ncbi:MAG: hypothetical protein KJ767_01015 [Nanoarchaeota archaeon]|nr:hypothetical protein [Nanoarchaeota archaeon]